MRIEARRADGAKTGSVGPGNPFGRIRRTLRRCLLNYETLIGERYARMAKNSTHQRNDIVANETPRSILIRSEYGACGSIGRGIIQPLSLSAGANDIYDLNHGERVSGPNRRLTAVPALIKAAADENEIMSLVKNPEGRPHY
jgi:hypothetical protein